MKPEAVTAPPIPLHPGARRSRRLWRQVSEPRFGRWGRDWPAPLGGVRLFADDEAGEVRGQHSPLCLGLGREPRRRGVSGGCRRGSQFGNLRSGGEHVAHAGWERCAPHRIRDDHGPAVRQLVRYRADVRVRPGPRPPKPGSAGDSSHRVRDSRTICPCRVARSRKTGLRPIAQLADWRNWTIVDDSSGPDAADPRDPDIRPYSLAVSVSWTASDHLGRHARNKAGRSARWLPAPFGSFPERDDCRVGPPTTDPRDVAWVCTCQPTLSEARLETPVVCVASGAGHDLMAAAFLPARRPHRMGLEPSPFGDGPNRTDAGINLSRGRRHQLSEPSSAGR